MASSLQIDRCIAYLARQHHGIVPHGVLLQQGFAPEVISRRLSLGLLVPVVRGASAVPRCDQGVSPEQRAIAAALVTPGRFKSSDQPAGIRTDSRFLPSPKNGDR